jgi:hypothetical protein
MENLDIKVNISVSHAAEMVREGIERGSMSGEMIDSYSVRSEHELVVMVFEKYYMRNSSRASLTVTLDNISGDTHVHAVGSGGGQGAIFKFDWGAASDFTYEVERILKDYIKR